MRAIVLTLTICGLCSAMLSADDQPDASSNSTKTIADHWLKVSRTHAETYTLSPVAAGSTPFALYEKPIFRHTQSVRGDDIGAMHVWTTADQRPAVVGVVFAWTNSKTTRMGSYEFHSLSNEPLQLKNGGKVVWTSRMHGFEWKTFPEGTLAPSNTKLQQRLQANKMARTFSANTTTGDKQKWELRLIPTPIYQYRSPESGVAHGAMYAFCQGTDTEVIMLIEAFSNSRIGAEVKPQLNWRFALVPFTDYKARVNYQLQPIWESPSGQLNQDGQPHFWSLFGSIPKPDFEIEALKP